MDNRLAARRAAPPEDVRTTVYLFVAIWLLLTVFAIVAYYLPPDAFSWAEGAKHSKKADIGWSQPLFDSWGEGVLIVDADTDRVVLANQALLRAGIEPESLLGKDVKQILPRESWLIYDRARLQARTAWSEENRYIRDDRDERSGDRPWLRVSLRGLPCRIFPAKLPVEPIHPMRSLAPSSTSSMTTLAKS